MEDRDPTPQAAGLRFAPDGETPPVLPQGNARMFALGRVLAALAELHENQVHGALRPRSVTFAQGALWLHVPAPTAERKSLRERISAAELDVSDIAYVAPEVIAGEAPTVQSDCYSAAALVVEALTGFAPRGHVDLAAVLPLPMARAALLQALDVDPARRPSVARLASLFAPIRPDAEASAESAADLALNLKRPRVGVDATDEPQIAPTFATPRYAPSAERKSSVSLLLSSVLAVGGVSVFVGALWLAFMAWTYFPDIGRLLLLSGLTAAVGVAAAKLLSTEWTRTGRTLLLLFTQLFWAILSFALLSFDFAGPWSWTIGAGAVAALTLAVASRRRHTELFVVAAFDALVTANLFWAALGKNGRMGAVVCACFALLILRTVAVRLGKRDIARLLLVAFPQSFLFALAYASSNFSVSDGQVAIVTAAVFVLTYVIALRTRRAGPAWAAALDFAIALFAFGVWKSTGQDDGFLKLTGLGAALYVVWTVLAHKWSSRAVSVAFAFGAATMAFLSGWASVWLFSLHDASQLWAIYPYLLWGLPATWALLHQRQRESADRSTYSVFAALLAIPLAFVPAFHALIAYNDFVFLIIAVIVGGLFLLAAHAVGEDEGTKEIALSVAGVFCATFAPFTQALLRAESNRLSLEWVHVALALAVAVALSVVAVRFSLRAQRRASYRVLEYSGVTLFMGLLSILSWARTDELAYVGLLFVGGALYLGAAVVLERAATARVAATALVVNLLIQYWVQLYTRAPLSVLLIGFGIGLLVAGLLFERRVKPLLPRLKDWS